MARKTNAAHVPVVSVEMAEILGVMNKAAFDVRNAEDAFDTAKGSLMSFYVAALANVPPISKVIWARDWQTIANTSYRASGRCKANDEAKIIASMRSATGQQQVIALALTNGYLAKAPLTVGETAKTFTDRARKWLKLPAQGLLPPDTAATVANAAAKAAGRASNTGTTPKGARVAMSTANMLHAIAGGDDAKTDVLSWAAGAGYQVVLSIYQATLAAKVLAT